MRFLLRLTSQPPAVVYVRSKKRDKISNGRQKRLSEQVVLMATMQIRERFKI